MRLVQGEAGTETGYGSPLDAALAWQADGAEWVHLVDLDAAFGRGSNRELLAEVVGRLDVAVELSGGIRDDESLAAALATGCARVNLGTAALESPDWVRAAIARHGERIAVGLDVRGTHAGRPGLDVGGRRPLRDAGPAGRRRLRPLRGDRRAPGRHPDRPEPGPAALGVRRHRPAGGGLRRGVRAGRPAPAGRPARASGWRARSSARRSTPVPSPCPRRWPPWPKRPPRQGPEHGGRGPGHPLPGRRGRPGGQGRQLHRPARRRRPGGAGPPLRRRGRRRADLPRHHRLGGRPADHPGGGLAHRRAGVHPAHRRRWRALGGRRRRAAAGRCRQGRGEHRRDRPPGSCWPRSPTGSAGRCWCCRWTPGGRAGHGVRVRLRGDHARRPAGHRHGRAASGPPGPPSSVRGRSC